MIKDNELRAMNPCPHDWRWVNGWYGDPNVINGTQDCSGWVCRLCDSTDNDEPKPERESRDDE